MNEYYQENRDTLLEYQKSYNYYNREKIKEYNKIYYLTKTKLKKSKIQPIIIEELKNTNQQ